MRRWTDGKSWSASRVSGSFLTYREMEGKRGGTELPAPAPAASKKANGGKSSGSSRNGDNADSDGEDGPGGGYRYKPDGLMKQSFSITTQDNRHLHLISYYARNPHHSIKQPSTDPSLRNIQPAKGMYPEAAVNEASAIPAVTRGPMVSTSPYPAAAPPPQVVVAYGYPPPGYPPMHHPYAPNSWPGSPAPGQPAHLTYYAHPHPQPGAHNYYQPPAGQHPHYPPYPYPGPPPATQERPPAHLPPPLNLGNSQGQTPGGQPSPRQYQPYRPNGPLPPQSSYSSAPEARSDATSQSLIAGPQLAPVANPTPPPSVTPIAHKNHLVEPAPIREIPNANGSTTPTKIIPSITSLINGDTHDVTADPRGDKNGSRPGSKSPGSNRPPLRDLPDAMVAGGLQRDKNDIKRLDAQLLKS
jgi:hypothetical protein